MIAEEDVIDARVLLQRLKRNSRELRLPLTVKALHGRARVGGPVQWVVAAIQLAVGFEVIVVRAQRAGGGVKAAGAVGALGRQYRRLDGRCENWNRAERGEGKRLQEGAAGGSHGSLSILPENARLYSEEGEA